MSKTWDKIKRGINHYHTKYAAYLYEKNYEAFGTRVKYMWFKKSDSSTLLVSFPGFDAGMAKYNYMRTLLPFKCHKLFLLDDFSDNHTGCYFVEEHVEQCTKQLIETIIKMTRATNVVFLGSSKGGYSALNFSFLIPHVQVVIGSPQYRLAIYLDTPGTQANLRFILGTVTPETKNNLNNRLSQRILSSAIRPQRVFFHYSKGEHTFEEHVKDMLSDLHKVGIQVIEDVHHYSQHGQLVEYYPPYLVKVLSQLLKQP